MRIKVIKKEKKIKVLICLFSFSVLIAYNNVFAETTNTEETSQNQIIQNEIKEEENTTTTQQNTTNTQKTNTNTTTSNDSQTTKTATKSSIATLANLGIKGEYDFSGFNANKTTYKITVPNEITSAEIYATKGQSGQKIAGIGAKTLKEGTNSEVITVTAEDEKTTKVYTIDIKRQTEEETKQEQQEETNEMQKTEETGFGLDILEIKGLTLTPVFKATTYEYTAELKEDLEKLDITASSNQTNANIEITGNENLQEGENIITILVTNEDGDEFATYQIVVNKNLSSNILKNKKLVYICGIIFLLVIVIIFLIIKKRKKNVKIRKNIPYSNLNNNINQLESLEKEEYKPSEVKNKNDYQNNVKNGKEQREDKENNSKGKRYR